MFTKFVITVMGLALSRQPNESGRDLGRAMIGAGVFMIASSLIKAEEG